jgi:hypothetical protein
MTPIERKRTSPFLSRCCSTMVLCINLVVSYLISFPLMMGEGKDGRRLREPLARRGVDPWTFPPHLNPPLRGGRNYFLAQLGYYCGVNVIIVILNSSPDVTLSEAPACGRQEGSCFLAQSKLQGESKGKN